MAISTTPPTVAAAPTHYHLHNFQHFEGTNLCLQFPPAQRTTNIDGSNIHTQQTSQYEREANWTVMKVLEATITK